MTNKRSRSGKTAPKASNALSYTNRAGATYYLHEGKTKTGKPRFFVAKTVREGARAVMPDGYEFSESINGVVSVRRVSTRAATATIPDTDLAMVRAELARHEHLRGHRVEAVKGEVVVFEPMGGIGGIAPDAVADGDRTVLRVDVAIAARAAQPAPPARPPPCPARRTSCSSTPPASRRCRRVPSTRGRPSPARSR
jgi:hypothetical protein